MSTCLSCFSSKQNKTMKTPYFLVYSHQNPQNRIGLISRLSRNMSCTHTTCLTPCSLHFIIKASKVTVPFVQSRDIFSCNMGWLVVTVISIQLVTKTGHHFSMRHIILSPSASQSSCKHPPPWFFLSVKLSRFLLQR